MLLNHSFDSDLHFSLSASAHSLARSTVQSGKIFLGQSYYIIQTIATEYIDASSEASRDYHITLNESFPAFYIEDIHNVTIQNEGWKLGIVPNNLQMWDPYFIQKIGENETHIRASPCRDVMEKYFGEEFST